MNFKEWINLNESLTLIVNGHDDDSVSTMNELMSFLSYEALTPVLKKFGTHYDKDYLTVDGLDDDDKKSGTLNFYVYKLTNEQIDGCLKALKYFMQDKNVKFGQFRREKSGLIKESDVIRIPVISIGGTKASAPIQLNITNDAAYVVFGDILGYPKDEISQGLSFSPQDLIFKINTTNDFEINKNVKDSEFAKKGKITTFEGGMSEDRIRSILDRAEKIAQWAIANHYDQLSLI